MAITKRCAQDRIKAELSILSVAGVSFPDKERQDKFDTYINELFALQDQLDRDVISSKDALNKCEELEEMCQH